MLWISTPVPYALPKVFDALSPCTNPLFWLDSAAPESDKDARSLLSLDARLLRRVNADEIEAPWSVLDADVARFRARYPQCPTGLVAWLSYESGFLGKSYAHSPSPIPMVEIYELRAALVETQRGVELVTLGVTAEDARKQQAHWLEALRRRVETPEVELAAVSSLVMRDGGSRAEYIAGIERILQAVDAQELAQVCLTYPITFERPERMDLLYRTLREIAPAGYCAFVRTTSLECASTSPECLFVVEGQRVLAQPMKGTRRRGEQPDALLAEELRNNPKDRSENAMIAQLLRDELQSICLPNTVKITKPFEVQVFANVLQMISTVEGELHKELGPFHVFATLAPPGSMTGYPKEKACEMLDGLEPQARGLYSGSIAWLDGAGRSVFSVVIRSLQAFDDHASWHVGGGIVAGSQPDEEWEESRAKAATLLESPGLVRGS